MPAPPPDTSTAGSRFGKYQLVKKLASGGMGEVFLAKQQGMVGFEKTLVIKRILAKHLDKQSYVDMFFSEARVAALLTHSNVVQIYDMGEEQEHYFIAMEYVHGRSMREIIDVCIKSRTHVPLAHILEMTAQACAGLSYAHNMVAPDGRPLSIVHRDINPQNILVSFHGEVKVIDFGIAKSSVSLHKTEAGTIKGKYVYMSPEQSAAEPLDKRSDIFALGIVLYEMCTGVNPFHHSNIVMSLEAIQRKEPPPLESRRPEVAILAPVVRKALAKEREDRYPDAAALRDDVLEMQRHVDRPPQSLAEYVSALFSGVGEHSDPGAGSPARLGSSPGGRVKPATSPGERPVNRTPPPAQRTPTSDSHRAVSAPRPASPGIAVGGGAAVRLDGPAPGVVSLDGPPPAHSVVNVAGARSADMFTDSGPTELEVDSATARAAASMAPAKSRSPKPRQAASGPPWALLGVLIALTVLVGVGVVLKLLGHWPVGRSPAPVPAAVVEPAVVQPPVVVQPAAPADPAPAPASPEANGQTP
jgi:serine/threonine-protein kinase